MRYTLTLVCLTVVTLLSVALTGCSSSSPNDPTPVAKPGQEVEDGHDHGADEPGHFAGDGHDHGTAVAAEHPTVGPHGGHLIELGNEEYHAELVHDEPTHTVTVYLLDAQGQQPAAVTPSEITLQLFRERKFVKYTLQPAAQQEATASDVRFAVVDEALCDALCHEDHVAGRLQVTIEGRAYTGEIEHDDAEEHDHEAHQH